MLEVIRWVPAAMAWRYGMVPVGMAGDRLVMRVRQGMLPEEREELELLLGRAVEWQEVTVGELEPLLARYYPEGGGVTGEQAGLSVSDDFLTRIIEEARRLGSSDVHVEVYERRGRVRFRVDGKLVERYAVEREDYPMLVNKMKVKANLDIAEKRLPQDGRIAYTGAAGSFDIRVSVLPTLEGEKVVLRLLTREVGDIGITRLGLDEEQLQCYRRAVAKPNGMVLISGPTGSGKTTTLYATLRELNQESCNVMTIEDPVEYTLEGVNQVQVREAVGMSYAVALKTFLRQDPDVIMLGEVRDGETAQMAVRAALTGHLVLATIHTNSAWGTVTRLLDMGVAPYLVANTLNLSMAQRLVRLLCPACKREVCRGAGDVAVERYLDAEVERYAVAVGCRACFYTGYRGRQAVYELIAADEEVCACVKQRGDGAEELMRRKGVRTLREGMMALVRRLETSPEEVMSYLLDG